MNIMENKEIQDNINVESVSVDDAENINVTEKQSDNSDITDTNLGAQIDMLNAQITELNDKYLRTAAELENTRRRAALDAESRARTRAMSIIEKILPVMDAIEAALTHTPDDAGIQSMARATESAFEQIGITKIKSVGQPLNPTYHNAIQVVEIPNDSDNTPTAPNTVVQELQSGYMFGENVLRPAMVVVSK